MTRVTAYLCARGAAEAIAWYGRVFGAVELSRIRGDNGSIGHAEIRIGETTLFISDEWREGGVVSPLEHEGRSVSLVLEVPDSDAVFARAVAGGARVDRPVYDQPGGRRGWLQDPFGHMWAISSPPR